MRFATLGLVLLSTGVVSPLWAADSVVPVVSELRIQKKSADDLKANLIGSEGVGLIVVLAQPDHYILGVNDEASKLLSATDDKGNDLTKNGNNKWLDAFFSNVNKNHHKIAIPVKFNTLPTPAATAILVKGDIVLRCGLDEKSVEIQPFDLAKGVTAQCGTNSLKVSAGGGVPFGGLFGGNNETKRQTLSVTLNDDGHWLKTLEFVDDKGKVIKSDDGGSSSSNGIKTRFIKIGSEVKNVGLRITYFQKIEEIHQPIDLKLGVGLS